MNKILESVSRTRRLVAPKAVIGGQGKIGKTTFAASAPDSVGILTEDGASAVDSMAFPLCQTLDDVYAAIATLANEEHSFRWVWVDSLDWLEPLIHAQVCKANNWNNIESPGYGKGYVAAAAEWRVFLDGLDYLRNHRGMGVILIVHSIIRRIEDPMHDPYDAHDIKLHSKAAGLVKEWADIIGFCDYDLAIKEGKGDFGKTERRALRVKNRILHLEPHPAHFGGNRLGLVNCELDFTKLAEQLEAMK
jgi:hypothetical protein